MVENTHTRTASSGAGPRIGFGGDGAIAVRVLEFLLNDGCVPACLVVADGVGATHAEDLRKCFSQAGGRILFQGNQLLEATSIAAMKAMSLDFLILVHLQLILPKEILDIPGKGVLNLHPAYLPDNRGWHTPSWAILNQMRFGATLHFMSEGIEEGDIVHQREIPVEASDTADALYQRALDLEFEVFREAWPGLVRNQYRRTQQPESAGLTHRKGDLAATGIQKVDLEENLNAGELIRRRRTLTTNRDEDACYFEQDNRRFRIQVSIAPVEDQTNTEPS